MSAFAPDVIVAQVGADTLLGDPLTHLRQTITGFVSAVSDIVRLSEDVCAGRVVLTGGGGYQPFSHVPRAWAAAMAVLLGREVPRTAPRSWVMLAAESAERHGAPPPATLDTFADADIDLGEGVR